MDYATLSILFLLAGLVVLVAEFFVPSGGFLAILTVISLVVSVWCAWKAWGKTSPVIWYIYLGSVIVLVPSVVGGVLYLLPRTEFGRRVILDAPTPEDVTPYVEKRDRLEELIGKRGVTESLMMPGGIVRVEGERMHAQSEGLSIESGQEVEVIGIKGNRIIVRLPVVTLPNSEKTEQGEPENDEELTQDEFEEPLDFDIS